MKTVIGSQLSVISRAALWLMVVMAGTAAAGGSLQVYLPRDVKIDNPTPMLGQIAILTGDEAMVQAASSAAMGRLALINQSLVIDRPTILSRLASSGIAASKVKFTGAEKISVSLKNTVISSENILQTATDCIKSTAAGNKISKWTAIRTPENLTLGEVKDNIKLKASQSLVQPNVVRVLVEAFADDKFIGKQAVDFRVKYTSSRIAAAADIAKDSVITPENTMVQNVESDLPQTAEQTAFYGMIAKSDIKKGTAITDNMLCSPKPQIVVKRNQTVVIKIESAAVMITATGKAMDDGASGAIIKVQNNDSKRVIMAKVNADGSVEPVF